MHKIVINTPQGNYLLDLSILEGRNEIRVQKTGEGYIAQEYTTDSGITFNEPLKLHFPEHGAPQDTDGIIPFNEGSLVFKIDQNKPKENSLSKYRVVNTGDKALTGNLLSVTSDPHSRDLFELKTHDKQVTSTDSQKLLTHIAIRRNEGDAAYVIILNDGITDINAYVDDNGILNIETEAECEIKNAGDLDSFVKNGTTQIYNAAEQNLALTINKSVQKDNNGKPTENGYTVITHHDTPVLDAQFLKEAHTQPSPALQEFTPPNLSP